MAGKPRQHPVDGGWMTVDQAAQMLGVTRQQIYNQMKNHGCGLQVVVNMIRENLALNNGYSAQRHMVDGKWMTKRQVAEMLGISMYSLRDWIYGHRQPDGSPETVAHAVEAFRAHEVKQGGSQPVQHKVGYKTMTVAEAAEKLGVSRNAITIHMHRRKASLAATIRYYERRKLKQAEKDILDILGF